MNTLMELSRWIRDYGNDPRHSERLQSVLFDWHQLWTALDVIEDVDLAISAYIENEFPSDPGEQYIRVYGILQALFVQQDALTHFVEVIRPAMSIAAVDVLKDVREARNASVGHPTKLTRKGNLSTHFMSQVSMSKEGFELFSFAEKDGITIRSVPVLTLIERQRAEIVRILTEVVKELKEDETAHKMKFRGKRIHGSFNLTSYAFEKISEELRGATPVGMGKWATDELQSSLDHFKAALEERGVSIDAYDSIKHWYGEISYPLGELRKFVRGEPSGIPSAQAGAVFADALQSYFSHLSDIAAEIDAEYSEVPD